MILSLSEKKLLVAHRDVLTVVSRDKTTVRTHRVSSSSLIRCVEGRNGFFAVKHHSFAEPPVRLITAHQLHSPGIPVAELEIDDDWQVTGGGDPAVWKQLPALFGLVYPYILHLADSGARIIRLPGIPGADENPDDPYRLVPSPDGRHAVVTSTRGGGRFVVYDLITGEIVTDMTLGYGPPVFRFRSDGHELWLAHSDTIFKISTVNEWCVVDAVRLSDRLNRSTISEMTFSQDEKRCAVAWSERSPVPLMQPYRIAPVDGEVLVFDTETMSVQSSVTLERYIDELQWVGENEVAMRERGSELHVRWASLEPKTMRLFEPRDVDDPLWTASPH